MSYILIIYSLQNLLILMSKPGLDQRDAQLESEEFVVLSQMM